MRSKVVALSVAALLLVAAVIVVLVVRDPGPNESATDGVRDEPPAGSTEPSQSPSQGHQHEGDHVDEVDPGVDPADYEQFCQTFLAMVDAYNSRVAERTPETIAAVESAAADLLAAGRDTDLTDELRAGLAGFVAEVEERTSTATPEEQGAFSTFLNSACPA